MRILLGVVCSIFFGIAWGCGQNHPQPLHDGSEHVDSIAKSKAIKAAEAHLNAKGGLSKSYEVDATVDEDGQWRVNFKFLPRTPGRHCTVIVDQDGTVLRVERGA
jgi:hypothetical protein